MAIWLSIVLSHTGSSDCRRRNTPDLLLLNPYVISFCAVYCSLVWYSMVWYDVAFMLTVIFGSKGTCWSISQSKSSERVITEWSSNNATYTLLYNTQYPTISYHTINVFVIFLLIVVLFFNIRLCAFTPNNFDQRFLNKINWLRSYLCMYACMNELDPYM